MIKNIRGTIYDTETAQQLTYHLDDDKCETLYCTPDGELFLHEVDDYGDDIRCMDRSDAHAWMEYRFCDRDYVKL